MTMFVGKSIVIQINCIYSHIWKTIVHDYLAVLEDQLTLKTKMQSCYSYPVPVNNDNIQQDSILAISLSFRLRIVLTLQILTFSICKDLTSLNT